ncbi:DUF4124 domain-containing protein [Polaromonas glacialis]|uniref:DUF4124 domain-containing protein n=1 Tax=Polaromonas glacialis TaxID=866564 RepID=UPI0004970AD2|nr:DUF4124 domain-containing protein [Polaromonas glacialis]
MRGIALRSVVAVIVFWTMTHAGHAQTYYTCMSAQGRPEFSEQPCSGRPAEKVESLNCRKARQELEAARFADPRRTDLQARRAAMNSACGLKPPHVTIISKPASLQPYSGSR